MPSMCCGSMNIDCEHDTCNVRREGAANSVLLRAESSLQDEEKDTFLLSKKPLYFLC
jgi:hypothetical protein